MILSDLVTSIKGIGDSKAHNLKNLGIVTVEDLIMHFPRDYTDRSEIKKIKDIIINEDNTICAKVKIAPENLNINGMNLTKIMFHDDTGTVEIIFFNQPYLKNVFKVGAKYVITGKAQRKYSKLCIQSPEYESADSENLLSGGRIVPIYQLTSKISQKLLRSLIKEALDKCSFSFPEFIPTWIRKKYNLCERTYAISNIHFPVGTESFIMARKRLVFEELFLLQLSLAKLKHSLAERENGIKIKTNNYQDDIEKKLPFSLTDAQKKVLEEINKDISSGNVMNRLLQGDVGSGKTIVALIAAYTIIRNGYQAIIMAPTEVLAQQHYEQFQQYFIPMGIKTVLLTGSLTNKEKRNALENIADGTASMIVGTHALIQEKVQFNKMGIVITDEQHRFGVLQRTRLSEKGESPHTLVMTATPIPRTLALILYGDLDISIIDKLPPGRQKIDTWAVASSYRQRIYNFLKTEIEKGFQAYIICPAIEENEKMDLKAVNQYTDYLSNELPEINIQCLHGKMKNNEKQQIMANFTNGTIKILVSTTVIEVGINVINATIMVIENAERFGLAQLHQLRGRVGRGAQKSYCILITDSKNQITSQRMKTMQKTNDGFIISEMDLKIRGPGEFFGTLQHGLPEMKIANLYKDMEILRQVQEAISELLNTNWEDNDKGAQLHDAITNQQKRYLSL